MGKPIVVELTKDTNGFPKGAQFGFASEAKATSALGADAFKVVEYQDKTAYEAPAAPQKAADGKKGS
jgi:hypothetical protein